jgi:thioredoxin reductase (NADPH)
MPSHFSFKKGIEDPNKEVISWIENSEFKERLFFKKNEGVSKISKNVNNLFEITANTGEVYLAKYIILCTGVMDIQPKINGSIDPILPYANVQLADYCLRCDGHHALNKDLTVFGNGDGAAWVGIMLKERYDCPSVTILTNGESPKPFSEEVSKLVDLYQMKLKTSPVISVLGDKKNKKLNGYELSDGEIINSDFTFISLGMIVYNELAVQLGAELDGRGFVVTNSHGESSVDGLYVAGDLRANAKKQVYTAWDHAVDSADKINALLRLERRQARLGRIE